MSAAIFLDWSMRKVGKSCTHRSTNQRTIKMQDSKKTQQFCDKNRRKYIKLQWEVKAHLILCDHMECPYLYCLIKDFVFWKMDVDWNLSLHCYNMCMTRNLTRNSFTLKAGHNRRQFDNTTMNLSIDNVFYFLFHIHQKWCCPLIS